MLTVRALGVNLQSKHLVDHTEKLVQAAWSRQAEMRMLCLMHQGRGDWEAVQVRALALCGMQASYSPYANHAAVQCLVSVIALVALGSLCVSMVSRGLLMLE